MSDTIEIIAGSSAEAIKIANNAALPEGLYVNDSFEITEVDPNPTPVLDRNGKPLRKNQLVDVPDPKEDDAYTHAFQGHIQGCRNGFIMVIDGDDNVFDIEHWRLAVIED